MYGIDGAPTMQSLPGPEGFELKWCWFSEVGWGTEYRNQRKEKQRLWWKELGFEETLSDYDNHDNEEEKTDVEEAETVHGNDGDGQMMQGEDEDAGIERDVVNDDESTEADEGDDDIVDVMQDGFVQLIEDEQEVENGYDMECDSDASFEVVVEEIEDTIAAYIATNRQL